MLPLLSFEKDTIVSKINQNVFLYRGTKSENKQTLWGVANPTSWCIYISPVLRLKSHKYNAFRKVIKAMNVTPSVSATNYLPTAFLILAHISAPLLSWWKTECTLTTWWFIYRLFYDDFYSK